jgi:hypothetical protein
MDEYALQILLIHGVKDAAAAALLDDPHRGFRCIVRRSAPCRRALVTSARVFSR